MLVGDVDLPLVWNESLSKNSQLAPAKGIERHLTCQTWGHYIIIFIEDDHISPILMHDLNSTVCVGLKDVCGQSRERCDDFVDGRPQVMFGERVDDPYCRERCSFPKLIQMQDA